MPRSGSKSVSWQENCQKLLQDLVKKSKSSRAALLVLSSGGDVVWQAGSTKKMDLTSIGALATAARGVATELDQITRTKSSRIQFGEAKKGYWVEGFHDWILVGVGFEPQKKVYENLKKHLKKKSGAKLQKASEAFDGLSAVAVETAVEV